MLIGRLGLSEDASDHQMRKAVAHALWKYCQTQSFTPKQVTETIKKNNGLVSRYTNKEQLSDQVDFLLLLQNDAAKSEGAALFAALTAALVLNELFTADGVKMWWDDDASVTTAALSAVRERTRTVVEAVLEQESDDSEEEDDDSEEEEEEEDSD